MTLQKIETMQRRIERNIGKWHPDHPIALKMRTRYRELETLKTKI